MKLLTRLRKPFQVDMAITPISLNEDSYEWDPQPGFSNPFDRNNVDHYEHMGVGAAMQQDVPKF